MPIDILMPQLSPTMTEGRLAGWLKKEGEAISAGDVIAEVETDKATMEVEATDDGILHKIIGTPGDDIKVGVPIAVLAEEGEKVPANYAPTAQAVEEEQTEEPKEAAPAAEASPAPVVAAAPAPQPVAAPVPVVAAPAVSSDSSRVKASPLAKRVAQEKGVDLAVVPGSGAGGRITKADVERVAKGGAPVAAAGKGPIVRLPDTAERNSPMRKAIASRLTQAKQTVPHFYLTASAEMDGVMEVRRQINEAALVNEEGKPAYKLSVNDFIVKAAALALRDVPDANAAWGEDSIVKYGNVDVSVAVATEGGLMTPIVFNTDQKDIKSVSAEIKSLAKAARDGKLQPEQYQGGSFSISNLGMYGVKTFSAIINPPQGAILAVGATEPRVLASDEGDMFVAQVMDMTLSVDHRVIDGALGADLLARIKFYLENPANLLI